MVERRSTKGKKATETVKEKEKEREGVKRGSILAEGDLQEGGHNGLKRSLKRAATAAAKYPRCRVPLAITARTYFATLRCDDVYALHRVHTAYPPVFGKQRLRNRLRVLPGGVSTQHNRSMSS